MAGKEAGAEASRGLVGPVGLDALEAFAVRMAAIGVKRFNIAEGSVEFSDVALARLDQREQQALVTGRAEAMRAEATDAEDLKQILANAEERKRIETHLGSA